MLCGRFVLGASRREWSKGLGMGADEGGESTSPSPQRPAGMPNSGSRWTASD